MASMAANVSNTDIYIDAQDSVNMNVKRSTTGTMMYGAGASQFYSKRSIIPIADSVEVEDDIRRSSVKLTKLTLLQDGATRFPKLAECAHFHYEFVDFGKLELAVDEGAELDAESEQWFLINVCCNERKWSLRRTYDSLYAMDKQLHRCIYDRKFSMLPELTKDLVEEEGSVRALGKISAYLTRFSVLADNMINCGPILCWMEMDNRGKRLVVPDNDAAVNIPAIGAAHVIKRYIAQSPDEISLEVGDILSIIDKPSAQESSWWRAKKEFEVGYFPSDYVEMIGSSKIPASVGTKVPTSLEKPVLHRRGKVTSFLVGFFSSRPNRTTLKRTGIVKERVFGCDLGEHLLNSGQEVPLVLKCCAEVLQKHGIVDGIYRLCGVASNLQKLRNEFDEDRVPDLTTEMYLQDIHCISSLVKMYFRELPNPLLTYQLYDKFTSAIDENSYDGKLMRLREIVQQLPPPHYRTTEFLLRHLSYMASCHSETSMHCKNLAIVWAPNLLRSKDLEQENCVAALRGAGLQAVVTEFLIANVQEIFDESFPCNTGSQESILRSSLMRPKSLCAPQSGAKLLSLEEAQERALGTKALHQKYISVGGGPGALPPIYHTVIELPKDRKKNTRRTTVSNLRALFARNHSMTLPSSGSESPSAVQRKISVEDETLRMRRRNEHGMKQDEADSFCNLLEGKRRSVSCDVFDSALLDPNERHSYSSSLILKNSSVKCRDLSTDATIENFSSLPDDVQPSLNMPLNYPVSFSATSSSSFRRAPKPPPRSQVTVDYSEPVSHSSVSYGDCQTPSAMSVSSFGSEQVFCDELESKYMNSSGNERFCTDRICNTDSLDTRLPFKNYDKLLRVMHDQDLPQQQQQSECTEYSAYPLFTESDTGSSIRMNNCYSGSERKMLSSERAYKSLQEEEEFLSWKLSESSGSKDLLTELSPAINRVMPGSNICSSGVDDFGSSQNRLDSPDDMYDSCQSLNIIIPASCDIGSIPENIGEAELDENSANDKIFSFPHFSFPTFNIHSKRSEELRNQGISKEYQSEHLLKMKGSRIEASQVPRVPQSPTVSTRPAFDILGGGESVMRRDSVRLCRASVQSEKPLLSDERDAMRESEPLRFHHDLDDSCSLTGNCGIEVTRKDRDCVSIKDRRLRSKGGREDDDSFSCTGDGSSDRLSSSAQHSFSSYYNYKCKACSSSAKACLSASEMAQRSPHADANEHPIECHCNRSASASECGMKSNPTFSYSAVEQSISEAEQSNCSSLVGLPFVSRTGREELSTHVDNKENNDAAGCRQRPSHMQPLGSQSNRFGGIVKLPSSSVTDKNPKLLPVNPLFEDSTNSKTSFEPNTSLSDKGRCPYKMHSPMIADEERIKSPSSSLRSVSSLSSSGAKASKSERKRQSPSSNIRICRSASTGVSSLAPVSSPSLIKGSQHQTDNKGRIVPSRSSASEFFTDFQNSPEAFHKANKASDSEPNYSTIYAGLLRSRATRSEPPEVLGKQSAGTYMTRSSAQVFTSTLSSFSPNNIPGTSSSLKERRKLFEGAVLL